MAQADDQKVIEIIVQQKGADQVILKLKNTNQEIDKTKKKSKEASEELLSWAKVMGAFAIAQEVATRALEAFNLVAEGSAKLARVARVETNAWRSGIRQLLNPLKQLADATTDEGGGNSIMRTIRLGFLNYFDPSGASAGASIAAEVLTKEMIFRELEAVQATTRESRARRQIEQSDVAIEELLGLGDLEKAKTRMNQYSQELARLRSEIQAIYDARSRQIDIQKGLMGVAVEDEDPDAIKIQREELLQWFEDMEEGLGTMDNTYNGWIKTLRDAEKAQTLTLEKVEETGMQFAEFDKMINKTNEDLDAFTQTSLGFLGVWSQFAGEKGQKIIKFLTTMLTLISLLRGLGAFTGGGGLAGLLAGGFRNPFGGGFNLGIPGSGLTSTWNPADQTKIIVGRPDKLLGRSGAQSVLVTEDLDRVQNKVRVTENRARL